MVFLVALLFCMCFCVFVCVCLFFFIYIILIKSHLLFTLKYLYWLCCHTKEEYIIRCYAMIRHIMSLFYMNMFLLSTSSNEWMFLSLSLFSFAHFKTISIARRVRMHLFTATKFVFTNGSHRKWWFDFVMAFSCVQNMRDVFVCLWWVVKLLIFK